MSHHLRKEKNCLNCGAEVSDRYCSHCGQENLIPKDTLGHLIQHFLSDITHYDSKFLISLRDLIFKPGFLTTEYLNGRRARYLNPVRMYFFISFVFFVVLFAQETGGDKAIDLSDQQNMNVAKQYLADSLRQSIQNRKTALANGKVRDSLIREIALKLDTTVLGPDTTESIGFSLGSRGFVFTLVENKYKNLAEYDSIQKTMPVEQRDGVIGRLFIRKVIRLKNGSTKHNQITVREEFLHNVPRLMFILLPLFALLLMLFYHSKKFTYPAHLIFSIHFHSFAFLLLLTMSLLNLIFPIYAINLFFLYSTLLILVFYLIKSTSRVYRQSFFISSLKAVVIVILYFVLLISSLLLWALAIFFTAK